MKIKLFVSTLILAGLVSAVAQDEAYGPDAGDWELTLGGIGSNDKRFDVGGFGIGASVGYFLDEHSEVSVRQSLNYSDFGDSNFNGSTRVAYDYHFDLGRLQPLVGVNAGGFYGDNIDETLAAGLEGGLKYYAREKTFVFALVEYQWLFDDANDVEDTFEDGQFLYTVGIGFHF